MQENSNTFNFRYDVEKEFKYVMDTMALEGIHLSEEVKSIIRAILRQETTAERECQKVIEKYRVANG